MHDDLFIKVERPEREGWYWFRWSQDHRWSCVEVVRDRRGYFWAKESNYPGDVHDVENMRGGEWLGPIPMPPD